MTIGWLGALTAVAIMALGSALQAAVGIGLALFVVPVLALIDPAYIPGPMLLAGTVLAAMTAWRERHAVDRPGLYLSLAGLLVGTIVGAVTLKAFWGPALPKVFGVLVLLAIFLSIFGRPIKGHRGVPTDRVGPFMKSLNAEMQVDGGINAATSVRFIGL